MASYTTEPKILINIHFGEPQIIDEFDEWFREMFSKERGDVLARIYGRHGVYGDLDVPDAEKVVEWLKAHGVEPRS